jgi:MOSC domain-containing protein YiiM
MYRKENAMGREYLTLEGLEGALVETAASPRDGGRVEMLVVRPAADERLVKDAVRLTPESGVEGDRWAVTEGAEPGAQVSLMNARLLRLLAGDEARMPLAGDNLVVDLELGAQNLPVGQRLQAGGAVLEITKVPHTGCGKFAERFGPQAVRFINAAERRDLRLRGCYARVVTAGTVRVGDLVQKIE